MEQEVEAISALLEVRSECGVDPDNKYLFSNQKDGCLDQYQTVQKVALQAGCRNPESVSCSILRKYIATVIVVCIGFVTFFRISIRKI